MSRRVTERIEKNLAALKAQALPKTPTEADVPAAKPKKPKKAPAAA